MKICIATSSFPAWPGDAMRAPFLIDAIAALRAAGCEVHVLTQAVPDAEAESSFGFPVTRFDWAGARAERPVSTLHARAIHQVLSLLSRETRALRELHARERFDAFLCCWAVPAGLCARLAGAPYAVWCLGSDVNRLKRNPVTRAILAWVLRGARARFADGFALGEEVARISGRACAFLPTLRTLPSAASGNPAPAGDRAPTELLFVGRHDPVKGVDLLLGAFAAISGEFPAARLRLAGDGPLTAALKRQADALGLGARVTFLGRVSEAALSPLYASADIVVIPSRSESIPLVLGEAAQSGKTVVVTAVGDMGRLVREYRLGSVADRPEAPLIAEALREALSGRSRIDQAQCQAFLDLLSFKKSVPALLSGLTTMEKTTR